MKRTISLIVIVAVVLVLCGCKTSKSDKITDHKRKIYNE